MCPLLLGERIMHKCDNWVALGASDIFFVLNIRFSYIKFLFFFFILHECTHAKEYFGHTSWFCIDISSAKGMLRSYHTFQIFFVLDGCIICKRWFDCIRCFGYLLILDRHIVHKGDMLVTLSALNTFLFSVNTLHVNRML